MRTIAIVIGLAVLVAALPASSLSAQEATDAPGPAPRPNHVYLVALEPFPAPSLESLAAYERTRYGVAVDVLPQLSIGGGEMSLLRRQAVAEDLINLMRRSNPDLANDPNAAIIGVTTFDMYAQGASTPYVFDWQQDGRYAVISSAHMDPNDYLRPFDPELMRSRVQKMVARSVGFLVFGLPASNDPTSVLAAKVASPDDLDRMGTDLPV